MKGVIVSGSDDMSDLMNDIMTVQYPSDSPGRPLRAIRSARNDLIYELMLHRGARARKTGATLAVNANSLT